LDWSALSSALRMKKLIAPKLCPRSAGAVIGALAVVSKPSRTPPASALEDLTNFTLVPPPLSAE
jgi:hypothetical protein